MYCMKCGKEIDKGAKFCVGCGASVAESEVKATETVKRENKKQEISNQVVQNNSQNYNNQNNYKNNTNNGNSFSPNNIPYEYRPISMWGYFGYQILFAIPCVGIILLLIFALGGTQNKNLRNFAASYFCMLIVLLVLVIIFAGFGILGAGIFYSEMALPFQH